MRTELLSDYTVIGMTDFRRFLSFIALFLLKFYSQLNMILVIQDLLMRTELLSDITVIGMTDFQRFLSFSALFLLKFYKPLNIN